VARRRLPRPPHLVAGPPRCPPQPGGRRKNGPGRPLGAPTKTKIFTRKPPRATQKWMASTPASKNPAPVIPEPVARGERARKEPERLDKEQEPIKRHMSQVLTGQRHEANQHKGKGDCAQGQRRLRRGGVLQAAPPDLPPQLAARARQLCLIGATQAHEAHGKGSLSKQRSGSGRSSSPMPLMYHLHDLA
jgi:hypothetical protein